MNSNYYQIPTNYIPNGYVQNKYTPSRPYNQTDDRFFGGFLGPFVLGGITGGLLAPAFYPPRSNYYPYPYPNGYYYGGYYR